jgi:hypothetical protein
VLAFPDVFDLFVNEFSSLCGRRFTLLCVLLCSFDRLFFRHIASFVDPNGNQCYFCRTYIAVA